MAENKYTEKIEFPPTKGSWAHQTEAAREYMSPTLSRLAFMRKEQGGKDYSITSPKTDMVLKRIGDLWGDTIGESSEESPSVVFEQAKEFTFREMEDMGIENKEKVW